MIIHLATNTQDAYVMGTIAEMEHMLCAAIDGCEYFIGFHSGDKEQMKHVLDAQLKMDKYKHLLRSIGKELPV